MVPFTFALLVVLKFGIFRPRLTRLDGPVVQILLQTHQATVGQDGVAAVRIRALRVGGTGVGVVVSQQVVLGGRRVDGAVDGAVGGRRAALFHLVRVIEDANCCGVINRQTAQHCAENLLGQRLSFCKVRTIVISVCVQLPRTAVDGVLAVVGEVWSGPGVGEPWVVPHVGTQQVGP